MSVSFTSSHLKMCQYQPTSYMPFKCHFSGGLTFVRDCMLIELLLLNLNIFKQANKACKIYPRTGISFYILIGYNES